LNSDLERRLLQVVTALACVVPFYAGGKGIIESAGMAHLPGPLPVDLDSHFRYLSGLLLGIGIGFASCIPRIEDRKRVYWTLGMIVVVGGLSRLASIAVLGWPGFGHRFGLAMELGVVPLLMLWQARIARLHKR
jgi:hypothetical protein